MIGLVLDLARQVRGILRPTYGGTGNTRAWARGTVLAYSNRTGASLPLMTAVRSVVAGGPRVEPVDTDAEAVLGVVVGYFDVTGKLVEADAPDNENDVAILVDGVTNVLTSAEVDRGDYAYASTTAGQVYGDSVAAANAFGQFLGRAGADGFAPIRILPGNPGSSGAPTSADYLVGTSNPDLSGEIVVGTTPGGELGGTWASPTVDTTHSGSSHASRAPNSADYLVGTADAGLTSEIVVGTTPGGELGGTWASPTVDSSHSGSTHAATAASAVTTAEAYSDAALAAHDHDGTPTVQLAQANTHQSPDTDAATSSLHHTLGTTALKAAAGNHTHSGIGGGTSAWFGDGSDGDIDLDGTNTYVAQSIAKAGSVYSLGRDIMAHNLTVRSGVTLLISATPGGGGNKIFANGAVQIDGTIAADGGAASGVTAGVGWSSAGSTGISGAGAAGRTNVVQGGANGSASSTNLGVGGNGSSGGGAGAQIAGGGGSAIEGFSRGAWRILPPLATGYTRANLNQEYMAGGGGGGGGACNSAVATTTSGGGGGGGGCVYIVANSVTIGATGIVRAKGGNGGNAASTSGGAAGGGGGGGGGLISIVTATYSNAGTVSCPGGTKGTGINGGSNGVDGLNGTVVQVSP